MANSNLTNARNAKNDEFYTQYHDIQKEIEAYLEFNPNAFDLDFEKLKVEYFGDQFAKKMYAYNCSSETLMVAEEKVNYLKSINVKQAEIKF